MDEIYVTQRSSGTIGESKSVCLHRFSILFGKGFFNKGKQLNNGKAKWQLFEWRTILSMGYWEWIEWKNCPGFTTLEILQRIQSDMENSHIEPEQFSDRILFMSIFNDIDIYSTGYEVACTSTSDKVRQYASNFVKKTLGIHWTRKRREVVSRVQLQNRWTMGLHCFKNGKRV